MNDNFSDVANPPTPTENSFQRHLRTQKPKYIASAAGVIFGGVTALFLISTYYPEEFAEYRDNLFQSVGEMFISDESKSGMTPD